MNIEFKDKALEDLYTTGKTKDHKFKRLSPDVITRYAKVVNFLRSARRLEDLFLIKSLHYEKKGGDLHGVDAVWITPQYRLLFYSSPDDNGIIVNALIFEISKHYE
jgi:proteic killer suppression protein